MRQRILRVYTRPYIAMGAFDTEATRQEVAQVHYGRMRLYYKDGTEVRYTWVEDREDAQRFSGLWFTKVEPMEAGVSGEALRYLNTLVRTPVKGQSHLMSFLEANANTFVGFAGSWAILQWIVIPFWGWQARASDTFAITCIFTIWSLIRGYGLRRLFNWLHHRAPD